MEQISSILTRWLSTKGFRVRTTLAEEFADGTRFVQLLDMIMPGMLNIFEYVPSKNMKDRFLNWSRIDDAVFTKLNMQLDLQMLRAIIDAQAGAIEKLLLQLMLYNDSQSETKVENIEETPDLQQLLQNDKEVQNSVKSKSRQTTLRSKDLHKKNAEPAKGLNRSSKTEMQIKLESVQKSRSSNASKPDTVFVRKAATCMGMSANAMAHTETIRARQEAALVRHIEKMQKQNPQLRRDATILARQMLQRNSKQKAKINETNVTKKEKIIANSATEKSIYTKESTVTKNFASNKSKVQAETKSLQLKNEESEKSVTEPNKSNLSEKWRELIKQPTLKLKGYGDQQLLDGTVVKPSNQLAEIFETMTAAPAPQFKHKPDKQVILLLKRPNSKLRKLSPSTSLGRIVTELPDTELKDENKKKIRQQHLMKMSKITAKRNAHIQSVLSVLTKDLRRTDTIVSTEKTQSLNNACCEEAKILDFQELDNAFLLSLKIPKINRADMMTKLNENTKRIMLDSVPVNCKQLTSAHRCNRMKMQMFMQLKQKQRRIVKDKVNKKLQALLKEWTHKRELVTLPVQCTNKIVLKKMLLFSHFQSQLSSKDKLIEKLHAQLDEYEYAAMMNSRDQKLLKKTLSQMCMNINKSVSMAEFLEQLNDDSIKQYLLAQIDDPKVNEILEN